MLQPTFNNKKSLFLKALREKVDGYFSEEQISTAGNTGLYLKSAIQICSAIGLYITLVFFTPGAIPAIILCALFGVNLALLGFNIMHEGVHQSFSNVRWFNTASSYFLNVMGGNVYYWSKKHVINHHTYTNIDGHDYDIELQPLMRMHHNQKRYWFHRFQHIYCFLLYGLSYFAWIFWQDFVKYSSGKLGPGMVRKKMKLKEHFIFWATKLGYILVYIVIPIAALGFIKFIIGFSIASFVCGIFISVVFQLAHAVEDASFVSVDDTSGKIDTEWAIHQLNSTANFGINDRILSWFLGGLNFQIEHHLFPKISHVHYHKISRLVRETCQQYNVQYIVYPTMMSALGAHLNHMRKMGKK